VKASINGFYAVYLTGTAGQGLVMLIFKDRTIVGVDISGVKYDGSYEEHPNGYDVRLKISIPPNTILIQGVRAGPEGETSELDFHLPADFLDQPFIRVNAKHGPVNAKVMRLRELDD